MKVEDARIAPQHDGGERRHDPAARAHRVQRRGQIHCACREAEPCVPRSGSSKHLSLYAPYYGCPTACTSLVGCPNWRAAEEKMRSCMRSKLANHIAALRPEPRLNSSALVQSRLARARMPLDSSCAAPLNRSRFTLIPAAAGGPGDPNQMLLEFNRLATITGGGLGGAVEDSYLVNVVDVVEWIGSSFDKRDHIILKMDIEGAEHSILNAMVQKGLLQLIDVLSLECHEPSGGHHACEHLISAIGRAAPKLQLIKEGRQHNGVDARSVIEPEEQARRVKACDAIDPERFSLSRREEPPHRRRLLNMRHAPRAPPPSSSAPSTAATVHILYCETRPGSLLRSSLARAMFGQRLEPLLLKVPSDDQPWAGTAFDISEDGLVLSNLCAGQKWAGWFMKYSALNSWYANRTREGITATSNELVMVIDSDMLMAHPAALSAAALEERFLLASNNGKHRIIFQADSHCWAEFGWSHAEYKSQGCSTDVLRRWGEVAGTGDADWRCPRFLNAGALMGYANDVHKLVTRVFAMREENANAGRDRFCFYEDRPKDHPNDPFYRLSDNCLNTHMLLRHQTHAGNAWIGLDYKEHLFADAGEALAPNDPRATERSRCGNVTCKIGEQFLWRAGSAHADSFHRLGQQQDRCGLHTSGPVFIHFAGPVKRQLMESFAILFYNAPLVGGRG